MPHEQTQDRPPLPWEIEYQREVESLKRIADLFRQHRAEREAQPPTRPAAPQDPRSPA